LFRKAMRKVVGDFARLVKNREACLNGRNCPYPPQGVVPPWYARMIKTVFWGEGTAFAPLNDLLFLPVEVPVRFVVSAIGYTTVDAGNFKMALYEDGPAGDTPEGGSLLASAGPAVAVADQKNELTITPVTLKPSLYWLAIMFDSSRNVVIDQFRNVRLGGTLKSKFIDDYGYALDFPDPCPTVADAPVDVPNMYLVGTVV